jgi:Na+-transporting methylmalonyl-CoA/oxaloacetate decarboxylase gamma subunit
MSEESQHVESGEVVDLRICNAVSRGMSMKEARAKFEPKIAAEKQEKAEAIAAASEPADKAELVAALTAAGVEFHPNAQERTLRKLWESHKEAGETAAE